MTPPATPLPLSKSKATPPLSPQLSRATGGETLSSRFDKTAAMASQPYHEWPRSVFTTFRHDTTRGPSYLPEKTHGRPALATDIDGSEGELNVTASDPSQSLLCRDQKTSSDSKTSTVRARSSDNDDAHQKTTAPSLDDHVNRLINAFEHFTNIRNTFGLGKLAVSVQPPSLEILRTTVLKKLQEKGEGDWRVRADLYLPAIPTSQVELDTDGKDDEDVVEVEGQKVGIKMQKMPDGSPPFNPMFPNSRSSSSASSIAKPIALDPEPTIIASSSEADLLRFKTSQRSHYDVALRRSKETATTQQSSFTRTTPFDVLLHCPSPTAPQDFASNIVTELSIANLAVCIPTHSNVDDRWITPAIREDAPFLDGLMRSKLIRSGQLSEETIAVGQIQKWASEGRRMVGINSLRPEPRISVETTRMNQAPVGAESPRPPQSAFLSPTGVPRSVTPTLPSKFRVPPIPPTIHRRLRVRLHPDGSGLLINPLAVRRQIRLTVNDQDGYPDDTTRSYRSADDQGIIVSWGPRPTVKRNTENVESITEANPDPTALDIGGIIGILRLWETAHLLIFLAPHSNTETVDSRAGQAESSPFAIPPISDGVGPITLFPSPVKRQFPARLPSLAPEGSENEDPLVRSLRAIAEREGIWSSSRASTQSRSTAEESKGEEDGDGSAGGDDEKQENDERQVWELRNVYAIPLTAEGGSSMLEAINKALSKTKPKKKPVDLSASSESLKLNAQDSLRQALMAETTDSPPTENETPVQAIARVFDPRKWALRQANGKTAVKSDRSGETRDATSTERSSRSSLAYSQVLGGDSAPSAQIDVDPSSSLPQDDDRMERVLAREGQIVDDGLPDPEAVMSTVVETQTPDNRHRPSPSFDWKKLNPFSTSSRRTNESKPKIFEQKIPGIGLGGASTSTLIEDGVLVSASTPVASSQIGQRRELESKIIREVIRELGSGAFFYSFETDLSHNLQHKRRQLHARSQSSGLLSALLKDGPPVSPTEEFVAHAGGLEAAAVIDDAPKAVHNKPSDSHAWTEPDLGLPLWRRFDSRFMWNSHLIRDFTDLGLHSYILPLMQGWVQSSRFHLELASAGPANSFSPPARESLDHALRPPSTPVDIVLISRRSKERAGLRFQRRGIDEDGHVANFVETEMMIRIKSSTLASMKPAPVLNRPVDQTVGITRLHFDDLKRRYGAQTIINLAETHGKEAAVTNGFRDVVQQLADDKVQYQEFDFHNECKGMRYENISKLITRLADTFDQQGYFWTNDGEVMREQNGSFRVNCIDCLDRTNVVESALARQALSNQLTQVGFPPDFASSPDISAKFNDVWANNGDQISRIYAGTSALKGDFTRTGKRDLTGMIHDGVNSVTRMFSGAVSDYFTQAVISYMVGQRSIAVFSEFVANLEAADGINLVRLSRIRAAAIEVCAARVIEDGEHKIAGWTLFSPQEGNTRITDKLEEKVLLLTRGALYVVSFDYNLEKVVSSTRIPLRNITKIKQGAYILSAIQEAGRDPEENFGFQVFFKPAEGGSRWTSYAVLNAEPPSPVPQIQNSRSRASTPSGQRPSGTEADDYFAFKALPREFVTSVSTFGDDEEEDADRTRDETCRQVVQRVVRRIKEECDRAAGSVGGYVGGHARSPEFVTEGDIVSLSEAQKLTSLLSRADYAIKRMLWLP